MFAVNHLNGFGVLDNTNPTPSTPVSLGSNASTGTISSIGITTGANIVAGDFVAVAITIVSNTFRTVSSVSDGTNTYSLVSSDSDSTNFDTEIWGIANAAAVSSGATITATFSGAIVGAPNGAAIAAVRIANVVPSSPLDQTAVGHAAASTSKSVTTGTLSSQPQIAIVATSATNGVTVTPSSGFTSSVTSSTAGGGAINICYQIVTDTAAVTAATAFSASSFIITNLITLK